MNIFLGIYGVLLIGGGFMGYKKAGSKMSLIMGLISGALVFLGLYLTQTSPKNGYTLIAITSAFLTGVFIKRLIKTKAFMPSGMLIVLSLLALVVSMLMLKQ